MSSDDEDSDVELMKPAKVAAHIVSSNPVQKEVQKEAGDDEDSDEEEDDKSEAASAEDKDCINIIIMHADTYRTLKP